jgi:hypothetical protein
VKLNFIVPPGWYYNISSSTANGLAIIKYYNTN